MTNPSSSSSSAAAANLNDDASFSSANAPMALIFLKWKKLDVKEPPFEDLDWHSVSSYDTIDDDSDSNVEENDNGE